MYLCVVASLYYDLDSAYRLVHDNVKYEVKHINLDDVLVWKERSDY